MNSKPKSRPILMLPQMVLIWFVIAVGLAGFLSIANGIQLVNSPTYCSNSCFAGLLVGAFYSLITALILSAILASVLFSLRVLLFRYEIPFKVWLFITSGIILGVAVAEAAKFLISQTNLATSFFSLVAVSLSIPTGLFSGMMGLLVHHSLISSETIFAKQGGKKGYDRFQKT